MVMLLFLLTPWHHKLRMKGVEILRREAKKSVKVYNLKIRVVFSKYPFKICVYKFKVNQISNFIFFYIDCTWKI